MGGGDMRELEGGGQPGSLTECQIGSGTSLGLEKFPPCPGLGLCPPGQGALSSSPIRVQGTLL